MKNNALEIKIQKWADEFAANGNMDRRDSIKTVSHQLRYLEKKLYCNYEPSSPPNPGYWQRLTAWINNLRSEEDQQLAFHLAAELFFVGPEEIRAMHRTAYSGPIKRWLIQSENIPIRDLNMSSRINSCIESTWFCPITDSMKINEFVHVNNIQNGINNRPDWHSLADLADSNELLRYIDKYRIKRLVLLEDFIATGSQASKAIIYASNLRPHDPMPVLVVPLILCPKAKETFATMTLPAHVKIEPVLQLEEHHFISIDEAKNSSTYNKILALAQKTYRQVINRPHVANEKPYDPLGFGKTGGLLVLGTNTPDNTLPLVHWRSDKWTPLFPRHSRV